MTASTVLRAATMLLLAGITLTACGGSTTAAEPKPQKTLGGSKSTPTPTPTPTPTLRKFQANGGFYVDVYDLQEAVVAAGGTVCKDFEYWGAVAFADGTISCDGGMMMIDVFDSPADLQKYKAKMTEMGNAATYDMDHTWLQGMNWLVRGEGKWNAPLKEKLGGEIATYSTGPSHR